jgi:hypothetical protein
MINTTVGAGAAWRYGSGSGSDQKMRLLAAPAPQHWKLILIKWTKVHGNRAAWLYFLKKSGEIFRLYLFLKAAPFNIYIFLMLLN